jgi:hypothetical protein
VAGALELTNWQEWALTSAGPRCGALLAHWPEDDLDPWAEAWRYHGERLLADWIEKYPGSRPWPWWVFEHGQERPIVNPMPAESEASVRRDYTYFGIVHSSILHGHGAAPGQMVPWQEPEVDYLARMGLLTPGEREALGLYTFTSRG